MFSSISLVNHVSFGFISYIVNVIIIQSKVKNAKARNNDLPLDFYSDISLSEYS